MTGTRLPAFDLVDDPVVADEETAFGDVPLGRRRGEGGRRVRPFGLRLDDAATFGQPADGGVELLGQVAVAERR